MKTNKFFLLVIISVLILSCKQSILEVENHSYKKEGIYCLVRVDSTGLMKIKYAPFDSLNNFYDLDITFNSQQIQMLHSNENNLLLVSNEEEIYFIDTRTNKLIKKINIEIDISDGALINRNQNIYEYNNEYCFLTKGSFLYKVYYKTMLTEKVYRFTTHLDWEVKDVALTHNGRYFYILTEPKYSLYHSLHQELYKYDIIKNEYKHLFSLERGSDFAGFCKDYYLIKNNCCLYYKYNIIDDKLSDLNKIYLPEMYRKRFYGNGKNNIFFYIQDEHDINSLNLNDNLTNSHFNSLFISNGVFGNASNALYYFSFSKYYYKIINIDTKKVEYEIPNNIQNDFTVLQIIVKETKL